MRGYIYHFINEQLPINKTQILENGLLEDKIFGVKIISKFENAQDVAEHISAILDETDKYEAFKNGIANANPNLDSKLVEQNAKQSMNLIMSYYKKPPYFK